MFDARLVWTAAAIILVTAVSFAVSRPSDAIEAAPITEPVSGIEIKAEPPSQVADYEYIMKEHNGHVAVYPRGKSEPEIVLDVLVKYLPDNDRAKMSVGIKVKDYNELVSLIEDYTS